MVVANYGTIVGMEKAIDLTTGRLGTAGKPVYFASFLGLATVPFSAKGK